MNYILLFSSQPTNRAQTQCSASVSPAGTLRIPVSASCTAVCSGFKADCQYKLNTQNTDDTDSGYQEALEIHCKFSRLTDRKLFIQCTCFESSNSVLSWVNVCWKRGDLLGQSSYRYVGVFICDAVGDKYRSVLIYEVNKKILLRQAGNNNFKNSPINGSRGILCHIMVRSLPSV